MILGSRKQREASGSGVSAGEMVFGPGIPAMTTSLSCPAAQPQPCTHSRWNSSGGRGRERRAHKPAGGASWPSLAWLEGEGAVGLGRQMPSAAGGPLKSQCCQAGPGCLQRSPASSAASCHPPGLPILGTRLRDASLWLAYFSLHLLCFFLFLYLSFCCSHIPSLFCPCHRLSFSLVSSYLFISFMPFLGISFFQTSLQLPRLLFL